MRERRRDKHATDVIRALRKKVRGLKEQVEARNLGIANRNRTITYWISRAGLQERRARERFDEAQRINQELYRATEELARANIRIADLEAH